MRHMINGVSEFRRAASLGYNHTEYNVCSAGSP